MSSASTRTPTSIEVRPTSFTDACTKTTSPTLTGCRKLIWSSEAVTTGPPACRLAAIPAAVSISFMISPPCTLPMMLALDRSMCWDRVTSEARGGLGARSWAAAALAASRTWSRSPSSGRDPPAPVPISLTPPALLVVPTPIPAEDSCPTSPASAPAAKDTLAMEMKLELVPIPVTDVDRAKAFYTDQVGFTADLDERIVETPPGSVQGLHLVVPDIHSARADLLTRGVEVSEVQDMSAPGKPTVSYAYFKDPDGNSWALQQLPS